MSESDPDQLLAEMRAEIDRIDASMHSLLMERSKVIDRLIEIKGRQGGGSAFRPGREAAMMRALLSRHSGLLPLDAVEGIWRIIIATFTHVQARFSVHIECPEKNDVAMRDSARFHFGFSVPLVPHQGIRNVIDAVAISTGDLGLVRIDGGAQAGAWWSKLSAPDAPKIIARLPVVDRKDHPASLPVFVVSKPLSEAASTEVMVRAVLIDRWTIGVQESIRMCKGVTLGVEADGFGLSLLVETPGDVSTDSMLAIFSAKGISDARISEVGSHAAIFEIPNHGDKRSRT